MNVTLLQQPLGEERAGEIALAILENKYRRQGFNCEREAMEDWVSSRAKRTGVSANTLETFAVQVILPVALDKLVGHVSLPTRLGWLSIPQINHTALRLLYAEFSVEFSRVRERIDSLIRDGVKASKEELIALVIHYILPHFVRMLTDADSVSITYSSKTPVSQN